MKLTKGNRRSNRSERRHFHRIHRRGTIVLIPMICLVLSLAVIGTLLKQTSIELKQLKKERYQIQANWLADAAGQRAVLKLRNQRYYTGETWSLSSEEIGGKFSGIVEIEIDRNPQNSQSITIRTLASYPAKVTERVRVIREWPYELTNPTPKTKSPSEKNETAAKESL